MGKIKNLLNALALAPGDEWQLAVRKKTNETIMNGNGKGFRLIPNTYRYWYADPFLFEYNGLTYVFAEMYDRTKKKGAIGWTILKDTHCMRFTVCLELECHLSYPCIFMYNNDIYMVPECYQSGRIILYRAVKFPNKWEECSVLLEGMAADTTPISIDQTVEYVTTLFEDKERRINDNLYIIDGNGRKKQVVYNDYTARCAGMPFYYNGKKFRPAQNCGESYGEQIIIKEIKDDSTDNYSEVTSFTVGMPQTQCDVKINLINDTHRYKFSGIHTYNATDLYEIIDLKHSHAKSSIYLIRYNKLRKLKTA